MRYNQSDFDYALESMNSVDLSTQVNRLVDSGDDEFASAILEAYEDMYTALEAGDIQTVQAIHIALEDAANDVETDPDVSRKAKRKALLKKVGAGAFLGVNALAGAYAGSQYIKGESEMFGNKATLKQKAVGGSIGATAATAGAALTAKIGYNMYNDVKKRRATKAGGSQETEAQESYFDYYFGG